MADEQAVINLVATVRSDFGSVDILVNNAGCQDRNYLENTTSEFWDQVQNVNVRGPFIAIREAVKVMRADGTKGRRSEEHTSELQSLMRISYAVCCLKKKTIYNANI